MNEIKNLEREIAEKQARLAELRAKEVDPLLIEAAAVCSAYFKAQDLPAWKEYLPDGQYAKDTKDPELNIALAALRRGMELAALPLAPVAPMSEEEIEGLVEKWLRKSYDEGNDLRSSLDAAIRETLRRAPNWPGEGELREMAHDISKQYRAFGAALEMARRIKAWQTGESA